MNLREWLFKQRLSITYFAGLMKVDRTYVHKWMQGLKVPSDDLMERIREISMDEVYEKEDLKDVKIKRSKPTFIKSDGHREGSRNRPLV